MSPYLSSERLFCSVDKSSRKREMYVYVNRAKGCSDLPEALLGVFGEPLHVMDMVLTPSKKLARASASEVLERILAQGFYLQMPPSELDDRIDGAMPVPNDSLHG
jgi:uncharacterized protein YcgL (UPF0745 family)